MLTLQDAKNRFSAVVEAAMSGRPQEVTRRASRPWWWFRPRNTIAC